MKDLKKIPTSLEWFGAPDFDYTDDDIDALTSHVMRIDTLILGGSNVTATGIGYLPRLHSIARLDLKDLNLGDECIPHLLSLQSLEYLHIGHNNFSKEGLMQLAGLKKLKEFIFSVPLVTLALEQEFQRQFPDCILTMCGIVGD